MKISKPEYQLARVVELEDGTQRMEIVPVEASPLDSRLTRRDFFGIGLTAAAVLGTISTSGIARADDKPTQQRDTALFNCDEAKAHKDDVSDLAITPDNKLLISGSTDNTVKLWNLPDGALLKTLEGHARSILALAITPDGKLLASGG